MTTLNVCLELVLEPSCIFNFQCPKNTKYNCDCPYLDQSCHCLKVDKLKLAGHELSVIMIIVTVVNIVAQTPLVHALLLGPATWH